MNRRDFWNRFQNGPNQIKIDYFGWCYFHISEKALREKIGKIEPNKDLRGEDDPPGPVSRWYGFLEGFPVILDFHHSHPLGDVVELRHGDRKDARGIVRDYFNNWGSSWHESPLA